MLLPNRTGLRLLRLSETGHMWYRCPLHTPYSHPGIDKIINQNFFYFSRIKSLSDMYLLSSAYISKFDCLSMNEWPGFHWFFHDFSWKYFFKYQCNKFTNLLTILKIWISVTKFRNRVLDRQGLVQNLHRRKECFRNLNFEEDISNKNYHKNSW